MPSFLNCIAWTIDKKLKIVPCAHARAVSRGFLLELRCDLRSPCTGCFRKTAQSLTQRTLLRRSFEPFAVK